MSRLDKKIEKAEKNVWNFLEDGTHVDLWSLVHFATGILVSYIAISLGFVFFDAALGCLFVLIGWEIIEPTLYEGVLRREFGETLNNQIWDIVIGFGGFLVYWFWVF